MNLLFDLDGTLTDPFLGITRCIVHALAALGQPAPPPEDLRSCIGPPLKQSFLTLLETTDDRLAETAIAHYRERFGTVGLFENQVYPGIDQALTKLRHRGHRLFVATSKPTVFATKIVEHFGLSSHFHVIYGSELDGTRCEKAELLAHLLHRESLLAAQTLMIGDREHDVLGAKANGLRAIGVLWGYGTRDELNTAGATICLDSPAQLPRAVEPLV